MQKTLRRIRIGQMAPIWPKVEGYNEEGRRYKMWIEEDPRRIRKRRINRRKRKILTVGEAKKNKKKQNKKRCRKGRRRNEEKG